MTPSEYPCVICGQPAPVHQTACRPRYTRRTRICPADHGFITYQNGGDEVLDCLLGSTRRNSPEYRQSQRTYRQLAAICEAYGDTKIQWCLERARIKAGVSK